MPAILRYRLDASLQSIWTIPAVLLLAGTLACLTTPDRHSLLLHTTSWSALCVACSVKTGLRALLEDRPGRATALGAGLLLVIGQTCERAAGAQNLWWANTLLPFVLYTAYRFDIIADDHESAERERKLRWAGPWSAIALLSLCGLIASYRLTGSDTLIALGLSYLVLATLTLLAIERAVKETSRNGSIIYTTSGLLSQPTHPSDHQDAILVVVRDIAAAAAVASLISAIALGSWRFNSLMKWDLGVGHSVSTFLYATMAVSVHCISTGALVFMVQREKLLSTSLVLSLAFTFASVLLNFTIGRLWFLGLAAAMLAIWHDQGDGTRPVRPHRTLVLVALASVLVVLLLHLRTDSSALDGANTYNPFEPSLPMRVANSRTHPIEQLTAAAQAEWSKKLNRQSTTLDAAVIEYRRRYGMSPPPNFDKWFEFAKTRDVKLIDEYDTIYHSLLPFWALAPSTTRARAREAIGNVENNLVGLLIRDGKAVHIERGDDWLQQAIIGLVEHFTEYLPDMDLAFNIHDEPRVVLPHAGLNRLVVAGMNEIASPSTKLENAFSPRPNDINSGQMIDEVNTTRFNHFPHQHTWSSAKVSCSADSPVGSLQEATDNLTAWALGDLGFIHNLTAFTDVCNSPSLETTHGFFERANAFNVIHDLYPIFSQSKLSTFQDIVYPSPWYWYDKVPYNELMDMNWDFKERKMWWRGSTTGGYSKAGGWHHHHRQNLVRKINAPAKARILTRGWSVTEVDRQDYRNLTNVHFSGVSQCDELDCAAQREYFAIAPKTDQQEAWKYKYLLDLDGNAYSGRFYAFLRSHSLVFKMAMFKEWHEDWVKPWVHYIPLSLDGEEILEAVRYVDAEPKGQRMATQMAETSTEWANSALRREDFEAWFFRLLLEYGRLVDDNRANIGFT